MYCTNCGSIIQENSNYCNFYGQNILKGKEKTSKKPENIKQNEINQIQCQNYGSYEIEVPGLGCI
jgi:hypothetical protein